ncbi:DNA-directed DNA polymerase [Malassezia sp. CBS 17886]|nr:DNA-directed DNA polymerase [Malassezia sp. CBS 17886]
MSTDWESGAQPNAGQAHGAIATEPLGEHDAVQSATADASSGVRPRDSEKGTTVFPVARVAKIIKVGPAGALSPQADTAVDICSKEATFLISAATVHLRVVFADWQELFVKKFVDDGCANARLDKRKMVRYDDMARAVQQNEFMDFLQEVIPMPVPLSTALQQRKEHTAQLDEALGDTTELQHEAVAEGGGAGPGGGKPRAVRKSGTRASDVGVEGHSAAASEASEQRAGRRQSRGRNEGLLGGGPEAAEEERGAAAVECGGATESADDENAAAMDTADDAASPS